MHQYIKSFYQELKRVLKIKETKQAVVLFASFVIINLLGIVNSSFIVRSLQADGYGLFAFILAIIGFVSLFFEWGYFHSLSRLLAKENNKSKQREFIALSIIIALILSLFFLIVLLILSFTANQIFNKDFLNYYLRLTAFPACLLPMGLLISRLIIGLNKMHLQAIRNILEPALFFLILLIAFFTARLNLLFILYLSFGLSIVISTGILLCFKPIFKNLKTNWQILKKENEKFGKHIFVSKLFERTAFQLDKLMLGYLAPINVGFYDLGLKISQPIGAFSGGLAESLYRRFAQAKRISKKIIFYNFLWSLLTGIILLAISKILINLIWGPAFLMINSFLYILILAIIFTNLYYMYYVFLHGKGCSQQLKKYSIQRGILNLGGNLVLIPLMGIKGAALATLASNLFSLSS